MRKKISLTPLYYLIFGALVIGLVFMISQEVRDRKISALNKKIRNLEELVTARQVYRNVIYTEVKENFIVDKRSLFTINYIVTAGTDLSGGIEIQSQDQEIRITYPYPQILSIDADESTIDEYFAIERFGKIKQSDYLDLVYDEKERIKSEALNSGLLERADENLRNLIAGLLQESGFDEISFSSERDE